MTDPKREEPPHCFGSSLWDPKAKECAGGMDPAFTDEAGTHVRRPCMFFDACGTKLQASRMEPARALLDSKSLVRRTDGIPTLGPAKEQSQTAAFVERFAHSLAQSAIPTYMQQSNQKTIHLPPQQVPQYQPPVGYQAMMPVNYQMPGYLTVPEVRHSDESFWQLLGRTILRSMGKSIGHSIAHLFDTVPLGAGRGEDPRVG